MCMVAARLLLGAPAPYDGAGPPTIPRTARACVLDYGTPQRALFVRAEESGGQRVLLRAAHLLGSEARGGGRALPPATPPDRAGCWVVRASPPQSPTPPAGAHRIPPTAPHPT